MYDYSGNPIALFPEPPADGLLGRAAGPAASAPGSACATPGGSIWTTPGNADRTIDPWTTVDLSFWFDLGGLGLTALDGAPLSCTSEMLVTREYETWGYWYGENYYTPAAGRNFVVGVDYYF